MTSGGRSPGNASDGTMRDNAKATAAIVCQLFMATTSDHR
jgi:hypothetical protein